LPPASHSWPGLEIASWGAFVQHAASVAGASSHRLGYLCRGQADARWGLQPSLLRLFPAGVTAPRAIELEGFGLEEFRSQAHLHVAASHLPGGFSQPPLSEWWALMQHHHAPTRLLDWTKSPYVAAYFAVEQHPDVDGAVFIVDAPCVQRSFIGQWGEKRDVTDADLQNPNAADLLLFWEPEKRTDRFVAQQGYFSLALNILRPHDDLLTNACGPGGTADAGPLRRWLFPPRVKAEVLRHLRVMNIAAHSLFPGLDGLGRSVAEIARIGPLIIPRNTSA
jgi:FRG domain